MLKGVEDIETQEEKMKEATIDLLAVVSEAGGGPWGTNTGLNRRRRELARMAEFDGDKPVTVPEHPEENSDINRPQVSLRT